MARRWHNFPGRGTYTSTTASSGSDRGFRSETRTSRYLSRYNARHRTLVVSGCVKCVRNVARDESPIFFLFLLRFALASFSAVNHGSIERKNHPEFPQRDSERYHPESPSEPATFRVSCEASRDLSVLAIVPADRFDRALVGHRRGRATAIPTNPRAGRPSDRPAFRFPFQSFLPFLPPSSTSFLLFRL